MLTKAAHMLTAFRKAHELSQAQIAARYGVTRQAVWKWERGIWTPHRDTIIALARDGVVPEAAWFASDDKPLLCGICDRRLDDPVNRGCGRSGCPRHLFAQMEDAA